MKINNLALCLLAAGLAPIAALPALAGQSAYANGSSTIVLMNGASQSIAAELGLPTGGYFDGATAGSGNLLVTPTLADTGTAGFLSTNVNAFATLEINAGAPGTSTSALGGSFTAAAAAALRSATAASDLSAEVSIIRAGAGVDGLE